MTNLEASSLELGDWVESGTESARIMHVYTMPHADGLGFVELASESEWRRVMFHELQDFRRSRK